ncbi:MAG: NlpC/P60 family protein [Crocinitomicaceae bacterium]
MSKLKQYAICQLAVCPLRAVASDEAEMVTQLVFGDYVTILEDGKPWIKIKNSADQYEGWMDFKQLKFIEESEFLNGIKQTSVVVGNSQLLLEGPFGPLTIFLGASLPNFDGDNCMIGTDSYTLKNKLFNAKKSDIVALSKAYLNAPYLWGGKSLFGIDCSGLTQSVFKAIGVQVARDTSEQVKHGDTIKWEDRDVNDVVFYTTSSNRVTHVGILVHKNEIIHAHGRVRIDKCDEKGIYNAEQDKYTHMHHSIKRWC